MHKIIARLRSSIQILFTDALEVTLPTGAGHFFPETGQVFPAIAGADGATDEGDAGESGEGAAAAEGGADESGDESGDAGEAGDEGDEGDEGADDEGADDGADDEGDINWKAQSRKHERRSKKEREKREAAEAELKKLKDARKSDHEKALEQAREEGRNEALTTAQKERQADRLEIAVARIAGKGIKVGEGEKAREVKFADPDDAHVYLNKALSDGDLDAEDVFDGDGKVKASVITEQLAEILAEKPHLAAGDGKPAHQPRGDGDQGKGAGAKPVEHTVEAQLERVKRNS